MQRLTPGIATLLAGALALACATPKEKDPGAVAAAYAAAGNYSEASREIDLPVRVLEVRKVLAQLPALLGDLLEPALVLLAVRLQRLQRFWNLPVVRLPLRLLLLRPFAVIVGLH